MEEGFCDQEPEPAAPVQTTAHSPAADNPCKKHKVQLLTSTSNEDDYIDDGVCGIGQICSVWNAKKKNRHNAPPLLCEGENTNGKSQKALASMGNQSKDKHADPDSASKRPLQLSVPGNSEGKQSVMKKKHFKLTFIQEPFQDIHETNLFCPVLVNQHYRKTKEKKQQT